jgi:hypothetical protein
MSSIPLTRIDSQTILLSEQYLEVSPEKWFLQIRVPRDGGSFPGGISVSREPRAQRDKGKCRGNKR